MQSLYVLSSMFLVICFLAGDCEGMQIRKAVLYGDQAYISFDVSVSGSLALDAPPDMVADSLTVSPSAGGEVRSVSVEPARSPSGKAKALREELVLRQSLLAKVKRELSMVDKQIEIIYLSAGTKEKPAPFTRAQLTDALGFIDARVPGLNARSVELSEKIQDLEVQVRDLQDRLKQLSENPGYRIDIQGRGALEVSYVVGSSSWSPEYRVLARPDAGQVVIETSASLRQATGLDWEVRDLFVSTGEPSFGIQAPRLMPWYLDRPRIQTREKKAMAESSDMAVMAAAPMEARAPVAATSTSFLIGAARDVQVPGDGTPHTVLLARQSHRAAFTLVAVPKLSPRAYLRAESQLQGDAPLVAGSYSSLVDGVFSGTGTMERANPGEKITLDLGVDEGVRVERKETKAFHEKTLTGRDRTTYAYEITLENTRSGTASITVKDQVPVSRDEDIEVNLIGASPEAKPDPDGMLEWTLNLGPREKRTVTFTFSVTGMAQKP